MERLVALFKEQLRTEDGRAPVEKLLDDALQDCATGLPTTALNDFAARTFNPVDVKRILARVWHTINTSVERPHLVRKVASTMYPPAYDALQALTLLHHCLIHGSRAVVASCSDRRQLVTNLARHYNRCEFQQYAYSQDLDVGAGVRKVAATIAELLARPDDLEAARSAAAALQKKLSTRGLGMLSPKTGDNFVRPSVYSDTVGRDSPTSWELGGKGHTKYEPDADID
ncbi:hypothetical protein ACHHYP_12990 [Achlya hypogyna]|uniref:ENTH domain-containing protein n=1 Tax=Achlya hypogyna TaxID=1202772 RepID=A0A1V9YG57_ACHHY|nr:hypothetical protein ACHHYP_12990 [Achlya hypogyna]